MKYITSILFSFSLFISANGQKTSSNDTLQVVKRNSVKKNDTTIDLKSQLIGTWKFHEITLRTPKDGYLMQIKTQEQKLIQLLIVNYTFNLDGSITLPSDYCDSLQLKEAKWTITDSEALAITYYFKENSEFNNGNTNKYETFTYTVTNITKEVLTIDLQGMFIMNFKSKNT